MIDSLMRFELLRKLQIPPAPNDQGQRVVCAIVKFLLVVMERRGRECFASQQTLASEVNCSVKTIGRALERLRELEIVSKTPEQPRRTTTYVINWDRIQQLVASAEGDSESSRDVSQSTQPDSQSTLDSEEERLSAASEVTGSHIRPDCQSDHARLRVGQNIKETKPETPPTSHDDWSPLEEECLKLGMVDASNACRLARERAVDVATARYWISLVTQQSSGRYAPGKLHKWLTGVEKGPQSPKPPVPREPSTLQTTETRRYKALKEARRRNPGKAMFRDSVEVLEVLRELESVA